MALTPRCGVKFGLAALTLFAIGATPAIGQTTPSPSSSASAVAAEQTSPATRIILLGTAGGPVARAGRSQPASLVQVGDRAYLVDAGEGVVHQLAKAGLDPAIIQQTFLTHLHVDHVAGLAGLISFRWLSRNPGGPSEIYGPPGTRQVVDGAVRFMTLPTEIHREQLPPIAALADSVAAFDKEAKGPTIIYKDDRVTVTAVENSHYSGFAPGAIPAGTRSYAYRFDTADRSIVFTGDTGPSEALEKLTAGADTLVSEVVSIPEALHFLEDRFHVPPEQLNAQRGHMADEHFQPERIGELAARAGVRLVVLNHVVMGNTDDGRAYTDGVRKTFKGVVALGQDLSEF